MAAGSISPDEFNALALKFAEFSASINDTWAMKSSPRDKQEIYLEKNVLKKDSPHSPAETIISTDTEADVLEVMTLEEPDSSCVAMQGEFTQAVCLHYQYHVLYSLSYSVPVLYFNVCKTDGKRLSLEEMWKRVPSEFQQRLEHHKWATLTQQEHPYLGTPWFMLHPCHTATLMSQVPCPHDTKYYLVKWLSSVGPVVGLDLSPAYATAFHQQAT